MLQWFMNLCSALDSRATRLLRIQSRCKSSIQYPPLSSVHFGPRIESEPAQFEVKTAARQAKRPRRFRNVAAGAVQRRLNHVALDLLDGRREIRGRLRGTRRRSR